MWRFLRFPGWLRIRRSKGRSKTKALSRSLARVTDVNELLSMLDEATDPLDRHFILERIVRLTFKRRKDDHKMRSLCERFGMQHLAEFPLVAPRLKREIGYGRMPYVVTFQCMATLMTEWGDYQKAIEIYEMALRYGINDREQSFQRKVAALRRLVR